MWRTPWYTHGACAAPLESARGCGALAAEQASVPQPVRAFAPAPSTRVASTTARAGSKGELPGQGSSSGARLHRCPEYKPKACMVHTPVLPQDWHVARRGTHHGSLLASSCTVLFHTATRHSHKLCRLACMHEPRMDFSDRLGVEPTICKLPATCDTCMGQ